MDLNKLSGAIPRVSIMFETSPKLGIQTINLETFSRIPNTPSKINESSFDYHYVENEGETGGTIIK